MKNLRKLFCSILFVYSQLAVSAEVHDATRSGDLESLKAVVESGSDVNDIDYVQGSPLHIAAAKGYVEIVEYLLQNDADYLSQEFGKSDTPLHWAALSGSTDVISLLLSAGADIDAQNDLQNTPLHIATESGKADAALLLIENGADVSTKNVKEKSAMHLAGRNNSFNVVDTLIGKGAQYDLTEFVSPLLESANIENGKINFERKCSICHAIDSGKDHDDGPSLWNIVGREIASLSSFEYSEALERSNGVWDYENLNAMILDGWNFWPGTSMGITAGVFVSSVKTRADIIAYLRTKSNDPVALP